MTWWLGGGVEGGGGGGGPEEGGLATKQPSPASSYLALILTLAAVLWIDPAACQQEQQSPAPPPAALPSPAIPFTPTKYLAKSVVRVSETAHYPARTGEGSVGRGDAGGAGNAGETEEEDLRVVLPELNLENNTLSEVHYSEGEVALLPCKFPQLSTLHQKSFLLLQVSWLRRADWQILTTGVYTYTSDQRFSVLHRDTSDQWTLQIKYAKARDSGTYECQMYTGTGVASQFIQLHVSRPRAAILGPQQLHVQEGDTVTLVCVIQQGRPPWVFWYHDEHMVNYDSRLNVVTHAEGARTHSRLTITSARSWDSGNYSCLPPNVQASSVYVYVSQGDTAAAVQRQPSNSATSTSISASSLCVMAVAVMAAVVMAVFCSDQGVLLNLLQAFPVR